jgi:hypothetical protein
MIILNGIKIQFFNFLIVLSKLLFSVTAGLILGFGLSFVTGFNDFLAIMSMNTFVFGILFMLIITFFIKLTNNNNKGT